ncbi:hypothetical protein EDB86DRAFT_2839570 [Lactarius hatsudake]|nr:hypothetical protein EDB86DRAFT_2839570 [Lactarius hatsudake]
MSGRRAGAGWLEMTRMLEVVAIACNVQGEREKKKKKHISNAFGPKPSSSSATFSILRSRGIVSHVGAACWGGDEWRWLRWLACTRGRQWPAALKTSLSSATSSILRSRGDGPRGITAWW